jgi:hypothetical protein
MASRIPGFVVKGNKVVRDRRALDASARARLRGKPAKRPRKLKVGRRGVTGLEPA